MTTHQGNQDAAKKERSLHRFRLPTSTWEWIERSYVIAASASMIFTVFAFPKDDPFRAKALLVAVLVFFVLASSISILQAWINGEKARYAEIVEPLHHCLHAIRDLDISLTHSIATAQDPKKLLDTKRLVQHELTTVLDRIVTSISLVAGVSVKAIVTQAVPDNSRLRVEVFARDSLSKTQWEHQDNPENNHWVNDNTSLRKIVAKKEINYYHNANVERDKDYESSFFEIWKHDPRYKSCLVLPIRGKNVGTDEHQYCGFLHVESMSRGAFNTRYDVDICAAIADSLYLVLSHYATLCSAGTTHGNEKS